MQRALIVSSLIGIAASTMLGQTVSFTIAAGQVGQTVFLSTVEAPEFGQVVQIVFIVPADGMDDKWSNDGMTFNYLVLSTVLHLGEVGNSFSISEVSQLSGVDPAYVQITFGRDSRFLIPLPQNRFVFNSNLFEELQAKVTLLRNTLHLPPIDWSSHPPPLRTDDSPGRSPADAAGTFADRYGTTAFYSFGARLVQSTVASQDLWGALALFLPRGVDGGLHLVLTTSGWLIDRTVLVSIPVVGTASRELITVDARLRKSTSDWESLAYNGGTTIAVMQSKPRMLDTSRASETTVTANACQVHCVLWARSTSIDWGTNIPVRPAEIGAPQFLCPVSTWAHSWPGRYSCDLLGSPGARFFWDRSHVRDPLWPVQPTIG